MDDFKQEMTEIVGGVGLGCPCCNRYGRHTNMKSDKNVLNRGARRILNQKDKKKVEEALIEMSENDGSEQNY